MFIPIEPAFLLAMQEGGDLWREAYERSVLLVGPTTLLFVIRIVDNLWQQEQQARSVADIVDRGTKLYEKFVNFVEDLTKVGESLRSADKAAECDEQAIHRLRKPRSPDGKCSRKPASAPTSSYP